jgi:signal transduction histidine kinase/DNA-binding response OmpR family regulator
MNRKGIAAPLRGEREPSFWPLSSEVFLACGVLACCGVLVGLRWGLLEASFTIVALLGLYGLIAGVRRRRIVELTSGLTRSNADLEETVGELHRTQADLRAHAAILEQQKAELEEARLAAETANRTKSEFLASMSHEIRTQMNGILGLTELLGESDLSQDQKECTRTMHASAQGLLTILNDILDLSRIEAGRLELESGDFALTRCVESVVELLNPRAREKQIDLNYTLAPDAPDSLHGDSGRLRQILVNLLGNAIRFTQHGEVELAIEVVQSTANEIELAFRVRDTGIGIAPERLEDVFDPFNVASGDRARRGGGTGLGLAIARRLVRMMRGDLTVESSFGVGSTFRFTAHFGHGCSTDLVAMPTELLLGRRLLVADGSPTCRAVVQRYARAFGMETSEASDAQETLAHLADAARSGSPFDVALLDSALPGLDGKELAVRIKSDHALRAVRLILLKNVGCHEKPGQLARAGFEAWISRPVSPSKLRTALMHVIDDPPEWAAERTRVHAPVDTEPARTRPTGPSVLLVEDNIVNQKVASLLLAKLGCRTTVAADGKRAVEAVRTASFDLILMDCQMPVMGGCEATRSIRALPDARALRIPIVAMTASAQAGDRERCLDAGMDDYLNKPVRLDELRVVLDRWAKGRGADPSSAEVRAMDHAHEGDVLDRTVIEGLKELGGEDDPELFLQLVGLFLEDTPRRMRDLVRALESQDADKLERAAHALKSSAANLGATSLSDLFKGIEAAGRAQDLPQAQPLVQQSEREFERVRAALQAEIG